MSGNYALKRRAVCSKRSEYTLIPDDGNVDTKEIEKIIAEVNRTAVSKSEFLSNQLLYYSRSDDTISIFKTHTRD